MRNLEFQNGTHNPDQKTGSDSRKEDKKMPGCGFRCSGRIYPKESKNIDNYYKKIWTVAPVLTEALRTICPEEPSKNLKLEEELDTSDDGAIEKVILRRVLE